MKIEKVVHGGKGMGYIDGKVCFVEGVLPGEDVEVDVTKDSKKFSEARVVSVKSKSPARVEPPCKYYTHCGGCQYQHMEYKEELAVKEAQVREMLRHHLKLEDSLVEGIKSYGEGYRYRNSVTLRSLKKTRELARLGYVARDNASSVIIDDCLLADEALKGAYQIKMKLPEGVKRVVFSKASDGTVTNSLKEKFYQVILDGKEIWAVSDGFFQSNHKITELAACELASWVKTLAPFGFFDLYSGVGTFSMLSANEVTQLVSIEDNASCNDAIRINMEKHRKLPWKHHSGKVEKNFPAAGKKVVPSEYMVFMDPPRTGLHLNVSEFLSNNDPFRAVAYLSCDLGNLTRDLKRIMAGGRYKIAKVVPFDMFGRTQHIETLTLLTPSGS